MSSIYDIMGKTSQDEPKGDFDKFCAPLRVAAKELKLTKADLRDAIKSVRSQKDCSK